MGDRFLVDIGNTAVKWARRTVRGQLEGVGYHKHAGRLSPSTLDDLWGASARPSAVWFANVAEPALAEQLAVWVKGNWRLEPSRIITETAAFGVINGYRKAWQLGVDRWLGLIAARARHRGAFCLVDLGTAATVDLVNERGEHLGGVILPGIGMSRRALLEFTRIPRVEDLTAPSLPFGRDTASAVGLGSRYALAGVVNRAVAHLSAQGEVPKVFLLGSEAGAVSQYLDCTAVEAPHLVLEGIGQYAGGG